MTPAHGPTLDLFSELPPMISSVHCSQPWTSLPHLPRSQVPSPSRSYCAHTAAPRDAWVAFLAVGRVSHNANLASCELQPSPLLSFFPPRPFCPRRPRRVCSACPLGCGAPRGCNTSLLSLSLYTGCFHLSSVVTLDPLLAEGAHAATSQPGPSPARQTCVRVPPRWPSSDASLLTPNLLTSSSKPAFFLRPPPQLLAPIR